MLWMPDLNEFHRTEKLDISTFHTWVVYFSIKLLAYLLRNCFLKQPSDAPLHTLSKLNVYYVPVDFVAPPLLFERQCIVLFAVDEVWLLLDIG